MSKINCVGHLEGHICPGGGIKGYIRKYSSLLCSLCRPKQRGVVEVVMDEKDIDRYNETLKRNY